MSETNFETYDFLINDEEETMLLLYTHEGEPQNPFLELKIDSFQAVLHRNDQSHISINDIPSDVIDSLHETDKLLVCELNRTNNEQDSQIVYAYEADITD